MTAIAQQMASMLTAQQLLAAYTANEIAADAEYKGKTIVLAGFVQNIGKDILGAPYIALEAGPSAFGVVQAMFPRSDESRLAGITKGQRVEVRCTCSGKLMNVILRECSFGS